MCNRTNMQLVARILLGFFLSSVMKFFKINSANILGGSRHIATER